VEVHLLGGAKAEKLAGDGRLHDEERRNAFTLLNELTVWVIYWSIDM
jgi:hypothetical protein